MAKPKTTYSPVAKNRTTFAGAAKNPTTYAGSATNSPGWLLNSTIVTLNSIVYRLSGYTGATPNQLNNKNATTFTAL